MEEKILSIYTGELKLGAPGGKGKIEYFDGIKFFPTFKCFEIIGRFREGVPNGVIKCLVNLRLENSGD